MTYPTRNLVYGVSFMARGEDPATERKLIQAGANRVVLPAHIGAERLSHFILFPEAAELIDDAEKSRHLKQELGDLGLELEEAVIPKHSPFVGKTVGELESIHSGTVIVVALHCKAGGTELRPGRDTVLHEGDGVIAVSRGSNLAKLLGVPMERVT